MTPEEVPTPEETVTPETATMPEETVTEGEPEQTFSADYVKQLRDEAASQRIKAKRIDEANARLLRSMVEVDGRLFDPSDLTLSADLLDDDGLTDKTKVQAAIQSLIDAKPHLAKRTPTTPLPQGARQDVGEPVSLFGLVKARL